MGEREGKSGWLAVARWIRAEKQPGLAPLGCGRQGACLARIVHAYSACELIAPSAVKATFMRVQCADMQRQKDMRSVLCVVLQYVLTKGWGLRRYEPLALSTPSPSPPSTFSLAGLLCGRVPGGHSRGGGQGGQGAAVVSGPAGDPFLQSHLIRRSCMFVTVQERGWQTHEMESFAGSLGNGI